MKFKNPLHEVSYTVGAKSYVDNLHTPEDILELAQLYAKTPAKKIGKKLDMQIKVANDLAKLTGGTQLKPGLQPGNKAKLLPLLKTDLISKSDYIKLYRDLVEKHKELVKIINSTNPKTTGGGSAARAAKRDMKGEFDESVNENKLINVKQTKGIKQLWEFQKKYV